VSVKFDIIILCLENRLNELVGFHDCISTNTKRAFIGGFCRGKRVLCILSYKQPKQTAFEKTDLELE